MTLAAEKILPADAPRPKWLAERRSGLGGSDVAVLMSSSPWSSPYSVWLDKTGRVGDIPDNWQMFRGREAEGMLAKWFEMQHPGLYVRRHLGMWRSKALPWAYANPDGFVYTGESMNPGAGIEFKHHGWRMRDEWEDEQVSELAEWQARWYMLVLGLDEWWICAAIGDDPPVFRKITRDRVKENAMHERASHFWHENVLRDVPPDLDASDLELVKDQHPITVPRVVIPDEPTVDLILTLRELRKHLREMKKVAEGHEAKLRGILGDAEAFVTEDGETLATCKLTKRSGYVVEATEYRSFSFPRGKK